MLGLERWSVVKSTGCTSKEPRFNSQNPRGSSRSSVTVVHITEVIHIDSLWYEDIHANRTPIYINKSFFFFFKEVGAGLVTFNPNSVGAEAFWFLGVRGQPGPCSKFKANQSYVLRPCLKTNKQKSKKQINKTWGWGDGSRPFTALAKDLNSAPICQAAHNHLPLQI